MLTGRHLEGAGERGHLEAGYSLVEVVIAVVIAGTVLLGAGLFVASSVDHAAAVQRQQAAPVVANQAMALVRAVTPTATAVTTATGTTTLLTGLARGRSSADVARQWLGASAPGLADSWPVSDPTAAAGSAGAVIPLQTNVQVGSTAYAVSTYVGACDVARSGGACTAGAGGLQTAPASDRVRMVRVVVEVTWPATAASSCPGSQCSYSTSALVDPQGDLTWNTNAVAATP